MIDCLFCKIVAGEIPATIVRRENSWVAFRDINPKAPTHVLIVPVKHFASVSDASPAEEALLGRLLLAVKEVAAEEGIDKTGYRVVLNSGESAGQSVFHLHVHLLGGRPMSWPPG